MVLPFRLFDRELIDAGVPRIHQTLRIELPIFIAVRTKPISGIVVIFVGETHRDPVAGKSPQLLDQPVVQLSSPLPLQEGDDLFPPGREFGAVAPARIDRVSQRDLFRVTRIPAVFGQSNLFYGCLFVKWRYGRARAHNGIDASNL